MLNHREALFARLRSMLISIAPLATQMQFVPQQLDELGRDRLFLMASEAAQSFTESWNEIAPGCAYERVTILEERFSGAENLTGEAVQPTEEK